MKRLFFVLFLFLCTQVEAKENCLPGDLRCFPSSKIRDLKNPKKIFDNIPNSIPMIEYFYIFILNDLQNNRYQAPRTRFPKVKVRLEKNTRDYVCDKITLDIKKEELLKMIQTHAQVQEIYAGIAELKGERSYYVKKQAGTEECFKMLNIGHFEFKAPNGKEDKVGLPEMPVSLVIIMNDANPVYIPNFNSNGQFTGLDYLESQVTGLYSESTVRYTFYGPPRIGTLPNETSTVKRGDVSPWLLEINRLLNLIDDNSEKFDSAEVVSDYINSQTNPVVKCTYFQLAEYYKFQKALEQSEANGSYPNQSIPNIDEIQINLVDYTSHPDPDFDHRKARLTEGVVIDKVSPKKLNLRIPIANMYDHEGSGRVNNNCDFYYAQELAEIFDIEL